MLFSKPRQHLCNIYRTQENTPLLQDNTLKCKNIYFNKYLTCDPIIYHYHGQHCSRHRNQNIINSASVSCNKTCLLSDHLFKRPFLSMKILVQQPSLFCLFTHTGPSQPKWQLREKSTIEERLALCLLSSPCYYYFYSLDWTGPWSPGPGASHSYHFLCSHWHSSTVTHHIIIIGQHNTRAGDQRVLSTR